MNRKNRWFAAIAAMFFGTFGVHKLYLGKVGAFFFYFFMFTLSISIFFMPLTFILGLLDSFKIMSMSDEEFDEKYNKGIPSGIPRGRLEKRRDEQMEKVNIPRQSPTQNYKNKSKIAELKKTGLKKYKDFDLEDAIEDFKKILELAPNDAATHFNIACAYSLTEKKEKAFEHISLSVQHGLKDVSNILSHDDLAYVRIQPEFENFKNSGFRNAYASSGQPGKPDALLQQLQQIADLRSRGLISDEEFNLERKKILRS
jgi:TM2 domain-containing membrane protein YozV